MPDFVPSWPIACNEATLTLSVGMYGNERNPAYSLRPKSTSSEAILEGESDLVFEQLGGSRMPQIVSFHITISAPRPASPCAN